LSNQPKGWRRVLLTQTADRRRNWLTQIWHPSFFLSLTHLCFITSFWLRKKQLKRFVWQCVKLHLKSNVKKLIQKEVFSLTIVGLNAVSKLCKGTDLWILKSLESVQTILTIRIIFVILKLESSQLSAKCCNRSVPGLTSILTVLSSVVCT
jgi:hypothetical protein